MPEPALESRLAMGSRSDSGLLLGWDLPSDLDSRSVTGWRSGSDSELGLPSGSASASVLARDRCR